MVCEKWVSKTSSVFGILTLILGQEHDIRWVWTFSMTFHLKHGISYFLIIFYAATWNCRKLALSLTFARVSYVWKCFSWPFLVASNICARPPLISPPSHRTSSIDLISREIVCSIIIVQKNLQLQLHNYNTSSSEKKNTFWRLHLVSWIKISSFLEVYFHSETSTPV